MDKEIADLKDSVISLLEKTASPKELEKLAVDILGRKGKLTEKLHQLGSLPDNEKKKAGPLLNQAKEELQNLFDQRRQDIQTAEINKKLQEDFLDLTVPVNEKLGTLHPITQIQREVEDIFKRMGFMVLDGPEVETEYANFDSVNIPHDHPARDMQDTFWTQEGNIPRTHTSSMQVKGMKRYGVPIRAIVPGRVFRNEATDARHECIFYQVEGYMVDKDISIANLIGVMKSLLRELFGREVEVRLRPGYFPFVEPGFELDFKCLLCNGKGCNVCKGTGWVEVLPCGMVHPNVLREADIDPDKYSGFAFGGGLDRLVMMRYIVKDIRYFYNGDLRFLKQF